MHYYQQVPSTPKTPRAPLNLKWKNGYWFFVGGALAGTYLAVHFYGQKKLLEKTCLKPAGFIPNKLSINEADVNVKLKLKNKSDIDYYLKNQIYNVFINDSFVAVIRNPNKILIAPQRTTDVWLNFKFNPIKVLNVSWDTLKDILVKGGDLKVQLQGKASVTAGILSFNYPVNETFKLKELLKPNEEPC